MLTRSQAVFYKPSRGLNQFDSDLWGGHHQFFAWAETGHGLNKLPIVPSCS